MVSVLTVMIAIKASWRLFLAGVYRRFLPPMVAHQLE
jgi:hypothetical protein